MGAHILPLKRGVMVGSADSGHPWSWGAELLPRWDVAVVSVLCCSWLCRAQHVKQRIPADALSYSGD